MAAQVTEQQRRFGARLRRWREARKLKVHELAALVPCSHSTISDVENGKRRAQAALLWKLAPPLFPDQDRYAVWGQLCEEAGIEWFGEHAREREPVACSDPLEDVQRALERGPWPARVVQGVTLLLEPWVVDSSGQRVAVEGG